MTVRAGHEIEQVLIATGQGQNLIARCESSVGLPEHLGCRDRWVDPDHRVDEKAHRMPRAPRHDASPIHNRAPTAFGERPEVRDMRVKRFQRDRRDHCDSLSH